MRDLFHRTIFLSLLLLFLSPGQTFAQAAFAVQKPDKAPSGEAVQQHDDAATPAESVKMPIHIVPFGVPVTPAKIQAGAAGKSSNNGRVQYWGGPVVSNIQVVQVLWGNFVDSGSTAGLGQFFTDITQSNYFDLLAEYSTVGLNGFGTGTPGSNQIIGFGTFATKVTINPSLCPGASTNPLCAINDTQIQNEIVAQLGAGHLPQPVTDPASGTFDTIYMIYFPPGVTISLSPTVKSCQRGGFCAYHSNVVTGNQQVPYGVFPDFSQGGCAPFQGCGNGTAFQNLSSASSHELAEAVTDPDAGSATTFAPPLAWADQNTGEEIGDFCAHNDTQITVNGTAYTVQTQWSNMQNACVVGPGQFLMQTSTANAVPGIPFQVTISAQSSLANLLSGYNNTVHLTSSDGAATLPADYTFVPNTDNGSHTFTVTLNSTGVQTVSVNDTIITKMTGLSPSVDIEHNPDLTVNMSHSGSFKQGDTGDTYAIVVTNSGDMPTNGSPVTVQLNGVPVGPSGMIVVGLSGTGWTCNTTSLQCTRADAVAKGTPYPAITLTVSVGFNAPATITPTVQISGGGELNTSNNQASDPTNIVQFPDLVPKISQNAPFSQGQIGAQYSLGVVNVNSVASSGTVTVTDTLPGGLTATAIGGTGWTCSTPPTLICTRSDSLPGGAFNSPITLTVNVDSSAPASVTNTVSVSGGGEINTGNDSTTLVTTIGAPTPDVAISASHSANLTQGETGATYTLIASNVGSAATNQAVTVTDNLPISFTATAISGTGWFCSLGTPLFCTRSDSLPAFTGGTPPSYPPVTITFNIAPDATAQQINSANVSGGGEGMGNTGNDGQADLLNIIQLPNLEVTQAFNTQLAQGLTGVNYSINVSDASTAATIGTVTATAQLSSGLTATAITGNGWNCTLSNLTCTRSDSVSASSYPSIVVTFNVAANAPSTASFTATVSGGGEILTRDDTSTFTTGILPPVSIITIAGASNVRAGDSTVFVIMVNAELPGALSLSCSSGVPPGAACLFSPPSITAPFNGTVNIRVTTTSALGSAHPSPINRTTPLYAALFLSLGGVMLAGSRWRWTRLAACPLIFLILYCSGCGGGGTTTPPPPPRVSTPPGTYTITATVNNTTANSQASVPLTLTVN